MSGGSSDIPCFDFGGNQDLDLFPCSSNGSYPQCCEPTQLCASNGLCAHRNQGEAYTPYVIGGCVDSSWSEEGCVSECKDIGYGVGTCSNLGPGYFCCYGTTGCNCTSTDSPGVFRKDNVVFVASLSSDGSLPATTSSEVSESLTSLQSSITSIAASATASTTATDLPEVSQTSETNSGDGDNTMPLGLGLGLGLGIPLLILIIAFVYFYKRRQSKKQTEQVPMMREHDPSMDKPPYNYSADQQYHQQQQHTSNGHQGQWPPQELDASHYVRTELDSTTSPSEDRSATNRSPLLRER